MLDAAYAEGQLGADEYHDRTAQATAAKTLGELERVVGDLQVPTAVRDLVPAPPAPPRNPLRRAKTADGYSHHTRARERDRVTTIVLLDIARRDGQLTEDEHQALTELAAEAKTLGELAELVDDLQRPPDASSLPQPPHSNRHRWFRIGVAAAAACAAVIAFGATSRTTQPEPPPTPAAAPAPVAPPVPDLEPVRPVVVATPNLLTRDGLTLFLQRYQEKFGDLQADELTIFDEDANITRMVPGQPNRQVDYEYRGGFKQRGTITTRRADRPVVDLATLNIAAISDARAGAVALLRVPDGAVTHMRLEVDDTGTYSHYGVARNDWFVEIFASNKFNEGGHVMLTPSGEVLHAWPFEG